MSRTALVVAMCLVIPLAGCASSGEGSASLYVKDAPTDEFSEVHVVFSAAYLHQGGDDENESEDAGEEDGRPDGAGPPGGQASEDNEERSTFTIQQGAGAAQQNQFRESAGWIELASSSEGIDVNLLNATGTRAAFLGEANLTAGTYTQIAIVLQEAYGIDNNGSRVDITVPSGIGRVVKSFQIEADQETQIIIDLDLDRALTNANGDWKLTPVFGKTQTKIVDDAESGSEAHQQGEVAEVDA